MTRDQMNAVWNGDVVERLHLTGWDDGETPNTSHFRGAARVPHAGEGRKLMAKWKRENKRGDYGKTHIRSEWTLHQLAAE